MEQELLKWAEECVTGSMFMNHIDLFVEAAREDLESDEIDAEDIAEAFRTLNTGTTLKYQGVNYEDGLYYMAKVRKGPGRPK